MGAGSFAMSASSASDLPVAPSTTEDGATGCAPIQSSASGWLVGGRPVSSAIAVREPPAYAITLPSSRYTARPLALGRRIRTPRAHEAIGCHDLTPPLPVCLALRFE